MFLHRLYKLSVVIVTLPPVIGRGGVLSPFKTEVARSPPIPARVHSATVEEKQPCGVYLDRNRLQTDVSP